MSCEPKDFMYPMTADIYYPIVEQGAYGDIQRQWMMDRSVACFFNYAGVEYGEDVKPEVLINEEMILLGRVKEDLRISSSKEANAITNVVVTNITDRNCNEVYIETAGSRKDKSTIFEIASLEPLIGPFGSIEYYKVVLRRSENQAVTI
jgi:hypothetical protein